MPCTQCGKAFGVFEKEKVCQNCDFIFCSRCLKYKATLPKHPNKESSVCFTCYDSITNPPKEVKPSTIEPPKILVDRMKAIGMKPSDFINCTHTNVSGAGVPSTSCQVDDLSKRLAALQDQPSSVPSIEELEGRMKKLRDGQDHSGIVKIRLSQADIGNVDSIVKKLTDEAMLEGPDDDAKPSQALDKDELPWCTMCNANATLRCRDCDDELFCSSCHKRSHQSKEERKHRTEPYKEPRK